MTDTKKRNFGWRPSIPDQRDYKFSAFHKVSRTLPERVDLRDKCSPIEDQGSLGSCCANATAGCLEFLELKDGVQFQDLSRLFHYFNLRKIEGTVFYDAGGTLRGACKAAAKFGICSEKSWPYNVRRYRTTPPQNCYSEAKPHKLIEYYRLKTLDDMRQALADGYIFLIGISVYSSFESENANSTGYISIPSTDEELLGGHAICIVGYTPEYFIFRNSWSESWGEKGYGWLPIGYLDPKNNLADDAWVIKKAAGF